MSEGESIAFTAIEGLDVRPVCEDEHLQFVFHEADNGVNGKWYFPGENHLPIKTES